MTIESQLLKINENLLLINSKRTKNYISPDKLQDIKDISEDYIPLHLEWIRKGNNWIAESLTVNDSLDREAFSQLLIGVRNLYLDLEELSDLLINVGIEIDGEIAETLDA